jgi:hypothetical protein
MTTALLLSLLAVCLSVGAVLIARARQSQASDRPADGRKDSDGGSVSPYAGSNSDGGSCGSDGGGCGGD